MSMFNTPKTPQTFPSVNPAPTANPVPVTPAPQVSAPSTPVATPQTYQPNQRTVSGVIGPRMVIKGDIEFEGELLVQGRVQGNITSTPDAKGTLVIEEKAEVQGNVSVPVVKVGGLLRGEVASTELLHITTSGSVEGPVRYNNLQLESGSSVSGSLSPEFKAKPRAAT